ncbi:MFS transporter [Streptomyces olivoverticillatus]
MTVYGVGSALTAVSPALWVLTLGWSVIEGLGATLVLPALAALVAGAYRGRDRSVAYGVIGGLAGAGIAVGPLLGGWVTTYLTWRLVFAGEVVLVIGILCAIRWIPDPPAEPRTRLDVGGRRAVGRRHGPRGAGGCCRAARGGWLRPRNVPFTVLGFSPTLCVIAVGGATLFAYRAWERRCEARGREPLVHFSLFAVVPLRSGLAVLLSQNLILLGLFFAIPLYLQVVQGFNAFQTGLRLLPVSVTMLLSAMSGPLLSKVAGPRTIVRCGLLVLFAGILWLIAAIRPDIDNLPFGAAMAVLGLGMGLLASQLGNIAQSSVGDAERSEAGGLQYTAQNLGSSLGTALIGSLLIGALVATFTSKIENNPKISDEVRKQAGVAVEGGVSFVSTDQVREAAQRAALPPSEVDAVVSAYADAQIESLKAAVLAAAGVTLVSFAFTRSLPTARPGRTADGRAAA